MKISAQVATSTAEIRRKMAAISEPLAVIVPELQAIDAERRKGGSMTGTNVLVNEDEKAARAHAVSLLGDIAGDLSLPPEVGRERHLLRQKRGIELALAVLQSQLEQATAAAMLKWWKTEESKWSTLIREAVLAAVRLNALDQRGHAMFRGVDLLHLPRIPLGNLIGLVAQTPIHELTAAALEAGVVSHREIEEVENAK